MKIIDECINQLCNEFERYPTRFFTENDLTCHLYSMINAKLPDLSATDADGESYLLLHTEYATPFRTNMKGTNFEHVENGGRGHYDLIALNPDFIEQHSYPVIYGQSWKNCKNSIIPWCGKNGPFILYGVEIMLKRRPLGKTKNLKRWGTWDHRIKSILQDYEKLKESQRAGFINQVKAIYFIREHSNEIGRHILENVPEDDSLRICFGRGE